MHKNFGVLKSLFLAFMLVGLTACDTGFHENNVQLISSEDAYTDYPEGEVLAVLSSEFMRKTEAADKMSVFKYMTSEERDFVLSQQWIAGSMKTGRIDAKKVDHCYLLTSGREAMYAIFQHVENGFYLASLSIEGCFEAGETGDFGYGIALKEEDHIHVIRAPRGHFLEWAEGQIPMVKVVLGIDIDTDVSKDNFDRVRVSKVGAYLAYIKENKDIFEKIKKAVPLYVGSLNENQKRAVELLEVAEVKMKAAKEAKSD